MRQGAFTVIFLSLLHFSLSPWPTYAASFDCKKARTVDERAICNDANLSQLEEAVAAAFREAKRVDPKGVRSLSRELLAQRRSCGSDNVCLSQAMIAAIGQYKAVIVGEAPATQTFNSDKIPYGTRAGMQMSIVSRHGINSTKALIKVEQRREDAEAFCRDYIGEVTEACIQEGLASDNNHELSANCRTGQLSTITGEKLIFLGRNPSHDTEPYANEYTMISADTNEPLDSSMASGYSVAIVQFQELCPQRMK